MTHPSASLMDDRPPQAEELLSGEQFHTFEVDGLRLAVRQWGLETSPAIVLLHGLRGYSGTWRGLARTLASSYRLIALDQRGRGASDWDPEQNYYTDSYLADLEAIVGRLGLDRFFLIGHSMGGTTSYVYAEQHPHRVAALIVEDIAPGSSVLGAGAERIKAEMAAIPQDFASWSEARAYWRKSRPTLSREAIEQRIAESLVEKASGRIAWRYDAAGISRTRLNPDPRRVVDLWPVVDRLHVPTLVIRGGLSDFCPADTVAKMERHNPNIRSATVAGASHYVHDDAPAAFAGHVSRFLAAYSLSSN